jgi:hypothetical protein
MEHPKSVEIVPLRGTHDLATVTARTPALFLPEPKATERFWEFFTANIPPPLRGQEAARR